MPARHAPVAGLCFSTALLVLLAAPLNAEQPPNRTTTVRQVSLADGALRLPVPNDWQEVKPRNRIIELEFAVTQQPGGNNPARFTVMPSGGTVQQNVARWRGQFTRLDQSPGGASTKPEATEVRGMQTHLVDLSGDYQDAPRGPFGPKVEKKDHRMLAAIVQTPDSGNYFFKLVGPKETVGQHAKAFRAMIQGIRPAAAAVPSTPES